MSKGKIPVNEKILELENLAFYSIVKMYIK